MKEIFVKAHQNFPQYNLSNAEWQELVALEYVLTWNYSDSIERDEKRHGELSKKRWDYIDSLKQNKP